MYFYFLSILSDFENLYNSYGNKFNERNKAYQQYNPGADYYEDTWNQWLLNRGYTPGADTIIKQNQETKKDPTQPTQSETTDDKPAQDKDLDSKLYGLPPIWNDDAVVGTLVKNSFPILKIGEVELDTPANVQGPTSVKKKGKSYKFVVKNEGGVTYNINNEYGPSMIEEKYQEVQWETMSEMFQLARSNRLLNGMTKPLLNRIQPIIKATSTALMKDIDKTVGFSTGLDKIQEGRPVVESLVKGIKSITEGAVNAFFRGGKIDIPNIWKGSNGPISYTGTIVLHCLYPDDDNAYEEEILEPLRILFRLASPHMMNQNGSEKDTNEHNDILTYENPPYVEAEVDGIFKSRIAGITNFSVNIDHKYQSFAKGGRPFLINVTLTITDLYSVPVWNDTTGGYAPNGNEIVEFMKTHERDTQAVPNLSPGLDFEFNRYTQSGVTPENNFWTTGGGADISGIAATISNASKTVLPQQSTINAGSENNLDWSIFKNTAGLDNWTTAAHISRDIYGNYKTDLATNYLAESGFLTSDRLNTVWNQPIYESNSYSSSSNFNSLSSMWGNVI